MTVSRGVAGSEAQGGLESVAAPERVASLTGIRGVAALLVVATHAAYTTGKYTHGYVGLVQARMEIGVPIFFVLSGFLLFRPWVKATVAGSDWPSVRRYAWHRVRRIMPAYAVTVIGAYVLYHFREALPNPGHTWIGFLRNLSLTQIYTDQYMYSYLHQGLTQMWSLAVEAAFYVVLPLLAWLLLAVLCRRRWRPMRLLGGVLVLAAVSPAWLIFVHTVDGLPDGARLWLPTYLIWFVGGMLLAVLAAMGVRCYAFAVLPVAVVSYFIASTPIAGEPATSPYALAPAVWKAVFYAVIATLMVAPVALGDRGWYVAFPRQPPDGLLRRDLLRDLPDPSGDDGDRDGRHPARPRLHGFDAAAVRGHPHRDGAAGVAAAPLHPRPLAVGLSDSRARPTALLVETFREVRLCRPRIAALKASGGWRASIGWPPRTRAEWSENAERTFMPSSSAQHNGQSDAAGGVRRDILPIPDVTHIGLTTYDAKDPDTSYPPIKDVRPPATAPNVLVILIDDVGFGASSAFGGPCQTPNFENLASRGLKYTRLHTTALCSPTRQALLTGRNHHSVGMGNITETATAAPGYTSVLPNTKAPLALTLKLNGYSTAQFGKCHEVPVWQTSPAGPFTAWPTGGGGFEYFYGFIGGENNQWDPALYEGTTPIEPPKTPAEGYHLTEDLTDKAIGWVRQQKALLPDKPFFMYFAPGATHAPHHVPKEWIDKYKGKFAHGWDRQREITFERQKELGVIGADAVLDAAARGDPGLGRDGSCAQAGAGTPDGGVCRILGAHRPSHRQVARGDGSDPGRHAGLRHHRR